MVCCEFRVRLLYNLPKCLSRRNLRIIRKCGRPLYKNAKNPPLPVFGRGGYMDFADCVILRIVLQFG